MFSCFYKARKQHFLLPAHTEFMFQVELGMSQEYRVDTLALALCISKQFRIKSSAGAGCLCTED